MWYANSLNSCLKIISWLVLLLFGITYSFYVLKMHMKLCNETHVIFSDNYKDAVRLMNQYQTGCNTSELQSDAEQEGELPEKRVRKPV